MGTKVFAVKLAACLIFFLAGANLHGAEGTKTMKGTIESTAEAIVKPVEVVVGGTGKVVESGLDASGSIVFGSLEAIKEGANEILPDNMEFVGDEADREGKDSGPKVRMAF